MATKEINAKGKCVLVIPDLHVPYHHKAAFNFLENLKRVHKPDIVISLGDLVDFHAISFHDSDVELFSAGHELEKAIEYLQDLHKTFPKMTILESNHDSLLFRKFKANGLPIRALKPLPDLFKTPRWEWVDKIVMDTKLGPVILKHGMSGVAGKFAKDIGHSTIEGHFHTKFHLTWFKNEIRSYYSIHAGCLVDLDSLAFAYRKSNIAEFCLGAVIIHKDGFPELIPLERYCD
jgi:predicted MPP superfamily phosphohydrolase